MNKINSIPKFKSAITNLELKGITLQLNRLKVKESIDAPRKI